MIFRVLAGVLCIVFLLSAVSGAGGRAPSGVGDEIKVGVKRSLGNYLEVKFKGFISSINPFDRSSRLRSMGVTSVS